MVFGFTVGESGRMNGLQALAPREAFRILDTWHVSGMRGTGSSEYEVAARISICGSAEPL
jgi:hypothetical protein